jgi:hypothetical protein
MSGDEGRRFVRRYLRLADESGISPRPEFAFCFLAPENLRPHGCDIPVADFDLATKSLLVFCR